MKNLTRKILFKWLLSASLFCNAVSVAFVWVKWNPPESDGLRGEAYYPGKAVRNSEEGDESSGHGGKAPLPVDAVTYLANAEIGPDLDIDRAMEYLKALGWKPRIAYAILSAAISDYYDAPIAREVITENEKWWVNSQPEMTERGKQLEAELNSVRDKLKLLANPGYTLTRQAYADYAYGKDLGSQIEEVLQIERDAVVASSKLLNELEIDKGNGPGATDSRRLVEKNRIKIVEKEVEAILAPSQYRQWELENSQTAGIVKRSFRSVDLSEDQYIGVFESMRKFSRTTKSNNSENEIRQAQIELKTEMVGLVGREAAETAMPWIKAFPDE